jgi:hypothetical protein
VDGLSVQYEFTQVVRSPLSPEQVLVPAQRSVALEQLRYASSSEVQPDAIASACSLAHSVSQSALTAPGHAEAFSHSATQSAPLLLLHAPASPGAASASKTTATTETFRSRIASSCSRDTARSHPSQRFVGGHALEAPDKRRAGRDKRRAERDKR